MSLFTPGRRWQPAFYPFKKEKFSNRLLEKIELIVKGPLYGCRMCGNCLLQETAFICPMECPKGLRNGPCGGSTYERCYVDETRPCIWYHIYKKSLKTGRHEKLLEILPPLDWDKVGTETWGDVVRQVRKIGTFVFFNSFFSKSQAGRSEVWENVFRPVRQPDWWNGDSEYHPPLHSDPVSELEHRLRNGEFVVTTELTPPLSANTSRLRKNIELVKGSVAAVNFTDSSSASPRMSSIACCKVANDLKVEPVLQIAARDINRTGLQAQGIGANEMGVRNILCISGDSTKIGPEPRGSMNLLDIDSIQMLWILRKMRDEGIYLDGRKIQVPPKFFLGAATSPFAAEPELQAIREHKKVNAGAQFFQTNLVFDPEKLDLWLEHLYKRDLLSKAYLIVGVSPLKNYKLSKYLHHEIPGISVPEKIMNRMEKAGDSGQEEGIAIALEIIDSLKKKQGISGIHLTTFGCESVVQRIIKESGLENFKKSVNH
jgi:methylenetetrahydrofolate reductase (NADPH)